MSPHARPLLGAFSKCFALLLLLLSSCAQDSAVSSKAHVLQHSPQRLELPRVTFGASTSGVITLSNTLNESLVISRIGPTSCSCNRFELFFPSRKGRAAHRKFDRRGTGLTLAPQEEVQLTIQLDTARFREPISYRVGGIPVVFEDHPAITLEWACDIFNPFRLEPRSIDLKNISVRERASGWVGLRAHDDKVFDVILPEQIDGWLLRKESFEQNGVSAWNIHVTAPREMPLGPFRKQFLLMTDLPEAPPIRFEVRGVVVADISLHPNRVLVRSGQTAPTLCTMLNKGVDSIPTPSINHALLPEGLRADLQVLEPGHRWELSLIYDGVEPLTSQTGELRISTEHPEHPFLTLPWTILQP